jgi:hypothetical protein
VIGTRPLDVAIVANQIVWRADRAKRGVVPVWQANRISEVDEMVRSTRTRDRREQQMAPAAHAQAAHEIECRYGITTSLPVARPASMSACASAISSRV